MQEEQKIKVNSALTKGLELFIKRNFNEADKEFKNIIKIYPNEINSNFYLGAILFEEKKFDESIIYLLKVISIDENHRDANFMIGRIFHHLKKFERAKFFFNKVYRLNKKDFSVLSFLAKSLIKLKNYQEAETLLIGGLREKPNSFDLNYDLGFLYLRTGKTDNCIFYLLKALEINKNSYYTYANLGTAYLWKSDFVNARKIFDEGLRNFPNNTVIDFSYSFLRLSECKINNGFKSYEKRKIINNNEYNFNDQKKEWIGQDLNGKTILIISEQGIGDTIQFSRYIFLLKQKYSVKIIFLVKKNLKYLFKSTDINLVSKKEEICNFDYFQYLLSLPGIFYKKDKKFFPNKNFIKPDFNLIKKWKIELDNYKGPKIGINYQGDLDNPTAFMRSIPLKNFEKLFELDNLNFISLNKVYGEKQIERFKFKKKLINFSNKFDNGNNSFEDTIAILKSLDLVITSDASLVHIASSMEIKTWLLLGCNTDWRWHINNKMFKWYKNLRIFQQKKTDDWESLMLEVNRELKNLYY